MRRRALLILVGLTALAVGTLALFVLLQPGSPINPENTEQIQPGMTRAEVEAILGGPAGDYRAGNRDWDVLLVNHPGTAWNCWFGDAGAAAIRFNVHDRVVTAGFVRTPRPPSLLTRVRGWLGL